MKQYPAYPSYKVSGVEWAGNIPDHWIRTKIKHLSSGSKKSFIDGDWIESPFITDDGIRLIQTGNVGIGDYKEQGYRYINETTFSELNCTEVFLNDVLICRLASPVGRACLAPNLGTRMITSVDNCILKPSSKNDSRFIVYQLSTQNYLNFLESMARGSTRARISRSMLGDLNFVMPPLPEQRAIADFLDRKTAQIDELIAKKQRMIELLEEQRTALINHAVTKGLDPTAPMKDSGVEWLGEIPAHWEVKKGKYLFKIISGMAPSQVELTDHEGNYYIKVDDLNTENDSLDIIRGKETTTFSTTVFNPGVILFPKRGAAIFTNKVKITRMK
jgi:type I restriction enzyme, S subunit